MTATRPAALTCTACGTRLDPIHARVGTHPSCDPHPTGWLPPLPEPAKPTDPALFDLATGSAA